MRANAIGQLVDAAERLRDRPDDAAGEWPRVLELIHDLIAGLPGAISSVPDGMAAAILAGVSPVRVSIRIGNAISSTGAERLRAMSTASAFSGEM